MKIAQGGAILTEGKRADCQKPAFEIYSAAMLAMSIGIPTLAFNASWCPVHIGALEAIGIFRPLIEAGRISSDQICIFEDMLIPFWVAAISGSWFFRDHIRQLATDAQRRRNMPNPGPERAFQLILWLAVVFCIAIFLMCFIPTSLLTSDFAAKLFFIEMMVLCSKGLLIGHAFAYA